MNDKTQTVRMFFFISNNLISFMRVANLTVPIFSPLTLKTANGRIKFLIQFEKILDPISELFNPNETSNFLENGSWVEKKMNRSSFNNIFQMHVKGFPIIGVILIRKKMLQSYKRSHVYHIYWKYTEFLLKYCHEDIIKKMTLHSKNTIYLTESSTVKQPPKEH